MATTLPTPSSTTKPRSAFSRDGPFTGSFRPLQPLEFFDGINGNGLWRLFVFDRVTSNIGTLVSWQLSFIVGDPIFFSDNLGNAFVDLPSGTHTVRLANEPGWVHTLPGDGTRTTIVAGAPVYQQTFGTRSVAVEVQTRAVFYAGSSFETNGGLSAAIDPARSALLPGQTTSNVNYTNYVHGINGLVVDILNAGTPTANDFAFATWDGLNVNGFTPLAVSPDITLLPEPVSTALPESVCSFPTSQSPILGFESPS